MSSEILIRLRKEPTIRLPDTVELSSIDRIRQMMIERVEAADEIDRLRAEGGRAVQLSLDTIERLRAANAGLVTALKDVVSALNGRVHSRPALGALSNASAAIAKAEGKS